MKNTQDRRDKLVTTEKNINELGEVEILQNERNREIEMKTINLIIKKVQQIPNIKNHEENYPKAHHSQPTLKRYKEKKNL